MERLLNKDENSSTQKITPSNRSQFFLRRHGKASVLWSPVLARSVRFQIGAHREFACIYSECLAGLPTRSSLLS